MESTANNNPNTWAASNLARVGETLSPNRALQILDSNRNYNEEHRYSITPTNRVDSERRTDDDIILEFDEIDGIFNCVLCNLISINFFVF